MRQHSLLVRGGRCTNATHIFVRSVIVKGSLKKGVLKILNAYDCINVHARRSPETRKAR